MARINLLPWREELRERKNKEFLIVFIFSLLLGLAAAFAAWTYFNNVLTKQRLANDRIATENKKLDAELTEIEILEQRREEIISRMRVIQDLQGKRPLPVRVWDDVANAIPAAMYLTEFKREGDVFTFLGKADNPNIISSLVRNLDSSDLLGNSKVVYFKQDVNAYDSVASSTNENSDRPTYPEDSYIEFVVTTEVSVANEDDENESSEGQTATASVNQEPVNQEPVNQEPVNQAPVNQAPVNQEPVNQEPVNQEPVNQEPVNQAPVNQAPVNQAPVESTSDNQTSTGGE